MYTAHPIISSRSAPVFIFISFLYNLVLLIIFYLSFFLFSLVIYSYLFPCAATPEFPFWGLSKASLISKKSLSGPENIFLWWCVLISGVGWGVSPVHSNTYSQMGRKIRELNEIPYTIMVVTIKVSTMLMSLLLPVQHRKKTPTHCPLHLQWLLTTTFRYLDLHWVILQDNGGSCLKKGCGLA